MTIEEFRPYFTARSEGSVGRFAPSTTGLAHPGTLIAALLCWLDARSRKGSVLLRLEDLDRDRTKPGYVESMVRDLEWFGLDWDGIVRQSDRRERHDAALEFLVGEGLVYACECSRAQVREAGRRAPDGSHRYPGTCRNRTVSLASWRTIDLPLRLRLDSELHEVRDESGLDLSGDASESFGDPIVRRRDGAYAYQFASVVDDADAAVDRVVRGRDLASSTVLQVALQRRLGLATPTYRHHCLLLERSGEKLSKLHGAVAVDALRDRYDPSMLCGLLATFVGLVPDGTPLRPADLVAGFDWERVSAVDVEVAWQPGVGLTRPATSEC